MASHGTKRSNEINMLEGPLLGKILLFALPLAASSLLQQLFNTADTMITGQLIGNDALAGVGATTPVVNMLVNLFVGLSVGANVVIAICVGRREDEKTSQAIHTSMLLALVSAAILIVLGIPLARPLLEAIGTPADVIGDSLSYMTVYYLGMPFVMIYNFGSAVLRGKGDTQRPLAFLAVGSALNVALDLGAVLILDMGVEGVAAATVASYAVTAALVVRCLLHEEGAFRLDPRRLRFHRRHLSDILKMGIPAGVQGMVFSISNLVIQSGINGFGPDAMAGSTATLNYEFFTYFVTSAFASTAVTFTSQNYAVHEFGRCKRVFGLTMACALVGAGLLSLVFTLGGTFFVGVFTDSPDAVDHGLVRMVMVEAFEWVACSYEVSAGALRGMKRSLLPTVIIMCGTVVFRLAYFFTVFAASQTYETLMFVYVWSWVLTGVAMLLAYSTVSKKAFRTGRPE